MTDSVLRESSGVATISIVAKYWMLAHRERLGRISVNADSDQLALRELYRALIDSWNQRDASRFADQFTERGIAVGFDGSQLIGHHEIAMTLRGIFANHDTATYVTI